MTDQPPLAADELVAAGERVVDPSLAAATRRRMSGAVGPRAMRQRVVEPTGMTERVPLVDP